MPYIIIATNNSYVPLIRPSPIVVGDFERTDGLQGYLGARGAVQLPFCPDSKVFVVVDHLREVMNKLEAKGYSLVSTVIVESVVVWIFGRPRTEADELADALKLGPNDKSFQISPNNKEDCGKTYTVNPDDSTLKQEDFDKSVPASSTPKNSNEGLPKD